jgi:hypothetical protein
MLTRCPWPELLTIGGPAFWLGVLIGWFSETRKESIMVYTDRIRRGYERHAWVVVAVIAILALLGIWLGTAASIQNGKNLITNCENANESRAAARSLWGYVLDASAASNPDPTPAQKRRIADFRTYVNDVYADHDCDHLDQKYPLPDPPAIDKG